MTNITLIGYARVSTEQQADSGLGVDAQVLRITQYCGAMGYQIPYVEVDDGVSGRCESRPALDDAIACVMRGDADGLIVAKLDRLARSASHFAQIMQQFRAAGKQLVCVDLGVDTSTPAGAMVAQVMAAIAQFESERIGERTKEAMQAAKAQGRHMGRPVELRVEDHDVTQMLRMRRNGASMLGISKVMDVPYNAVRRVCKQA